MKWAISQNGFIRVNKIYFALRHRRIYIRAHWQIFVFHFNFWYTLSSVFFNSKTGLFACIFWSENTLLCKFSYLHLLSGLQGRICQKIYDVRRKKSVWFQCHCPTPMPPPLRVSHRFYPTASQTQCKSKGKPHSSKMNILLYIVFINGLSPSSPLPTSVSYVHHVADFSKGLSKSK